jgi:hypothetical protein
MFRLQFIVKWLDKIDYYDISHFHSSTEQYFCSISVDPMALLAWSAMLTVFRN